MLKTRVIPTLLYKGLGLVKGEAFDSWRRVGSAMQAVKVYNLRNVDEMIFLDIGASTSNSVLDFETVDELADECFVPLTVGGGLRSVQDVRSAFNAGADKVSVGTAAVNDPALISSIAGDFGSQAVVISIDVVRDSGGKPLVATHCGTRPTQLEAVEWAMKCEELGAGEILLTSVANDGTMNGYDLNLLRDVTNAVNIPVIVSGGAGKLTDFSDAVLHGGASAVAAASLFHFTEMTPMDVKTHLSDLGIRVRL